MSRWAQPAEEDPAGRWAWSKEEDPAGRWGRPSEEELAAILAAVELCWPRPVEAGRAEAESPWRFSGRWWAGPATARRPRPWVDLGA